RGDPMKERSAARGLLAIAPASGLASLRAALSLGETGVLVGLDGARRAVEHRSLAAVRALDAPDPPAALAGDAAPAVAPRGDLERAIASIWREVLRVDALSIHDNFFDLGGHSMLLMQVRARLQRALGRDVPMLDLFRFPTVSALAASMGAPGAS